MKTAEIVVDTLERVGVTHAFGLVGSTVLSILDELDPDEITYVSTRHEQVAAAMAAGYALAAREAAVSISHVGPGAANQVIGVAAAYRDDIPVISITGNEPSTLLGGDVNHEWDVMEVFERFTDYNVQVSAEGAFDETRNAVLRAVTGMPGAVHIDVPIDIADADTPTPDSRDLDRLSDRDRRPSPTRSRPATDAVTDTIALLESADRPVVIAGSELRWFEASAALARFAELVEVPVATAQNSRGILPETHELSLGHVANTPLEPATGYVSDADLVIGIGTRFSDKVTDDWTLLNDDADIVQASIREDALERHYLADVTALCDPRSFLVDLADALDRGGVERTFGPVAREAHAAVADARAELLTPDPSGDGVDPRVVVAAVDEALDDYTYTTGGGVHNFYPSLLPVDDPTGHVVTANFTGMSQGFPLGMGARLALDRPVVVFEGDGGFAMVVQDLETAVREDIPVKVIVLNNDAYMSHAVRQREWYGGRYVGTHHGNPRFDEVARAFGATGLRVDDDDDVHDAVRRLVDADGPGVLDVRVDPEIGAMHYA